MQIDYANLNVVQQVAAASNCEHANCHGPDYVPGGFYEVVGVENLSADPDCLQRMTACMAAIDYPNLSQFDQEKAFWECDLICHPIVYSTVK